MINDPTPERQTQDQRLRDALMRITTNPTVWDQANWLGPEPDAPAPTGNECGTAGCLAGWLIHDAGILRYTPAEEVVIDVERAEQLGLTSVSNRWGVAFEATGAALAGLDQAEANTLFDSRNRLAALWELTAEFTDGRVKLPPELYERVQEIDAEKQEEQREQAD